MIQQPANKYQRQSGPIDLDIFNVDAAMIGGQGQIANLNSTNSLNFFMRPKPAATSS